MKISNQHIQRMLQAYAADKTKRAASSRPEQNQLASGAKDRVELSELAQLLARLRSEAKEPLIRQELVDSIRRRIADGTYHVDAKDIAGRMLEEAIMDRIVREEDEQG